MAAPPTKVQNFLVASFLGKKGEVDPVNDTDLIGLDHHAFDQRTEDLATSAPIGLVKVCVDRVREAVETGEGFAQCSLLTRLGLQGVELHLEVRESFSRSLNSWFKLITSNHAIRVRVDQSVHRSLRVANLLSKRLLTV